MDTSLIQILITAGSTVFAAAIASLVSLQAVRVQDRRKAKEQDTDRAAAINDMAIELLAPYKAEMAELRAKIHDLECDLLNEREKRRELEELNTQKDAKIADMQKEIDALSAEVEALKRNRRL